MHPLPDSWDCKDSRGREWGWTSHEPGCSRSCTQPSSDQHPNEGSRPWTSPPQPSSAFRLFVPSYPAIGVLWPLPGHTFLPPGGPGAGLSGWAPGVGPVDQTLCTHCQLGGLDGGSPSLPVSPEISARGLRMCLFRAGLCQSLLCAHSVPSNWVHTGTPPRDPAPPAGREQIVRSQPTHCWKGPPAPVTLHLCVGTPLQHHFQAWVPQILGTRWRPGALGHVGAVCLGQGEAVVHCGQNVPSLVSPASFPGLSPSPHLLGWNPGHPVPGRPGRHQACQNGASCPPGPEALWLSLEPPLQLLQASVEGQDGEAEDSCSPTPTGASTSSPLSRPTVLGRHLSFPPCSPAYCHAGCGADPRACSGGDRVSAVGAALYQDFPVARGSLRVCRAPREHG